MTQISRHSETREFYFHQRRLLVENERGMRMVGIILHTARQKRAEKTGLTIDDLLQQDQSQEREREQRNQKKSEAVMGEYEFGDGGLEQSARTSNRQPPGVPAVTGVMRQIAAQMTNLFS